MPELRPWLAWTKNADSTDLIGFLDRMVGAWDRREMWNFVIVDENPIGDIGLELTDERAGRADIGYWISSDRAGRGLMTEAATAVLDFAFNQVGVHRVELRAAPDNIASIRVAEKLGFIKEGLLRESGLGGTDQRHDHFLFALLADDARGGQSPKYFQ